MSLDITITDLFCGAGGASTGMVAAGGVVTHAANHWKRAVETYETNNQDTRVLCADISQTDPGRFPTTDVLWASPECTTFSQAAPKVRKAELFDGTDSDHVARSRVTMWDVVQFADVHRYAMVIVENVVDIGRWTLIDVWFDAMRNLGYEWRTLSINSFIAHPTPQSRDRWYTVFWKTENPAPDLDIRPSCWCGTCERTVEGVQTWKKATTRWGKYRQQYTYRCATCGSQALPWVWPAAAAIDWSLPCPRIGDRDRPLAPATLRRIQVGLERYGPAVVQAAGNTFEREGYYRTWPTWQPIVAQTTTTQHGVALPAFMLNPAQAGNDARFDGSRVRGVEEPMFTQTGAHGYGLVSPFMLSQYDYEGSDENRVYSAEEPVRTIVGEGNHQALVVPVHHGEDGPGAAPAGHPHRTQTGRAENALVIPMRTHNMPRSPSEPLAPMTTSPGGGHTLVELPFIAELRGGRSDARPVAEPAATVCASGNHHGLVAPPAVLVRMNGGEDKAGPMALPVDGPSGTITGAANQAVVPFLTHYYGNARPGHSPVSDPTPTMRGRDSAGLVVPEIRVEDCGFRMLEPHEAGAAMAFPHDYVVLGNKRDRVRQYGQAVTPPVAELILGRCLETLGGRRVA